MSVGRRVLAGAAALAAVAAVGVPTSPAVAAPLIPATFTFSGAGSSHGVGMSQWGARGMALEGYTAEQIVTHYYSGTTVTPVADSRNIRVNVLHRQTKAVFRTEALAAGGGGIRVEVVGSPAVVGDASDVWTLTSGKGPVTVTRTRAGVTTKVGTGALAVVRWAGTRDSGGTGTAATLLNLASSAAGFATSGHRFRYGTLDFATTPASPTTFEAVNPVRIHDEYLLGISEISSSWPMEALRAQVLASRSYALARVGETQRAACRCNVDNGFGGYYDQTFVAWSKESGALGNRWRQAVLSTGSTASTGETILYAGKPIQAFYFAASGGATQSSADVWGGALPWAVSVDDHWSMDPSVPWSSWNPRVRTQAQVAAVFGLPNVVRLDLTDRSVAGALRNVTAWSSTGASKTVSGVHFAGSSGLGFPSRWVWRAGDATPNAIVAAAAVTAARSATTTAVIAPTTSPASIAVASVLAARKGWPLLLSSGAGLPAATIADLKRRKATRVVVVGTVAHAPASVLTALSALGATATRITGATDSDVSASAASSLGYPAGGVAWVAAATDLPSLASAASAAARAGRPFLVEPGGAIASASVSAYLTGLAPARTLVVGSVSAVAAAVASALPGDARLVGADASQTSALVLNATGLPVASRVVVASPNTAITGLLISAGSPVIIVTGALPTPTLQYLQRGVVTVASPAGTPVAFTWAARRA